MKTSVGAFGGIYKIFYSLAQFIHMHGHVAPTDYIFVIPVSCVCNR